MNILIFMCGALVGAVVATMFLSRHASRGEDKTAQPEIGSRWNFRGHDGDVVVVEGNYLIFVHEDASRQTVPLDYFMAVAKPEPEESVGQGLTVDAWHGTSCCGGQSHEDEEGQHLLH